MTAGVKLSGLLASSGLDGTEVVPVVDGGVTKRTTVAAIAALAAQEGLTGLPEGVIGVDGYTGVAGTILNTCEATTGWTAIDVGAFVVSVATDATYFTTGTKSVKAGLHIVYPTARFSVDLSAPVTVAPFRRVVLDVRWDTTLPESALSTYYHLVIADSTTLTGNREVATIPIFPMDGFATIGVDVGDLTSIRSIGLESTGTILAGGWTMNVWIDNVRFANSTELDQALASDDEIAVLVPPSYVPGVTQDSITPAAGKAVLDLRTSHAAFTGLNGERNLRDWGIVEDGSVDVSNELSIVLNSLLPGDRLTFPANSRFWVDQMITVSDLRGVTINANGARFFANSDGHHPSPAGSYGSPFFRFIDCDATIENWQIFGYQADTTTGGTLTTLNAELATAADRFYARTPDLLNKATFRLSDSAHVASDCVIECIYDDADETVVDSTTLTLTGTPTAYELEVRPHDLTQPLIWRVRKATATTNTITVAGIDTLGYCRYQAEVDSQSGIEAGTSRLVVRNALVEGVGADSIAVSNADTTLEVYGLEANKCGRQGISFNRGVRFVLDGFRINMAGRSGIDIEPYAADWLVGEVVIRNGEMWGITNYALAMNNWGAILRAEVDNVVCYGAGVGFIIGGARAGHMLGCAFRPTTTDLLTTTLNGQNMVFDIETSSGVEVASATGGSLGETYLPDGNDVTVRIRDGVHSGTVKLGTAGTAGANRVRVIQIGASELQSTGAYVGPVQVSSDFTDYDIDLKAMRLAAPNTYKGRAVKGLWFPEGLDVKGEGIVQAGGISGTATKPRTLGARAVAVAQSATTKTVAFASTGYAPSDPHLDSVTAATVGGATLADATYYYRIYARPIDGGPGPAMPIERSVVVSGAPNAVTIGINGWLDTSGGYHVPGVTIRRGTSPGTYTHRYDVVPTERWWGLRSDSSTFVDEGSVLRHAAYVAGSEWGYPLTWAVTADSATVVDETGWESDALYSVFVSPSWLTTWRVTAYRRGGFDLEFGTAAPGSGSPTLDYFIARL